MNLVTMQRSAESIDSAVCLKLRRRLVQSFSIVPEIAALAEQHNRPGEQSWKIAVVGAGAIGSLFGAMLAKAGHHITLIGRADYVAAVARDGLRLQRSSVEQRVEVLATTEIAGIRGAGLVLLCVKSMDTDEAARQMAPHLAAEAVILSLQNGVDNPERIRVHLRNRVVPVLVYAGANIPAPGIVQHTAGNSVVIGQLAGDQPDVAMLEGIAALFGSAGIDARISADISSELWTKLVMNCAYNVISALSGARYGEMAALPEIRDVMRAAVDEVAQVARAKGVRLPGDIAERAIKLADTMPTTTSSTAQDFARGRKTEVDHLNGYVVRSGEAFGIVTPVNRTLTALMKLSERTRRGGAP
jgi:2-dehydropantoate 2-reductase